MLTKEEKIWIIQHYTQSPHRTQLRRDFIHHFNITNEKKVPNTTAIKRIIWKFEEEGTVSDVIYRVADHFALRCKMCIES